MEMYEISMDGQREAMKKMASKVAKKAGTKIAKRINTEDEREGSMKCRLAKKVMHESLEMYEEGTFDWKEMIDDLATTLRAMENMKSDY